MSTEKEDSCEKTRKRITESKQYQDMLKRKQLAEELRNWIIDCIPHGKYKFSIKKGWKKRFYIIDRYKFLQETLICFNASTYSNLEGESVETLEFLLQNKDNTKFEIGVLKYLTIYYCL